MRQLSFRTLQQLFELCGHLRTRHIVTHHAAVLLAYHGVDVIQGLVRVGEILPGVPATALLAVQGRSGNGLPDPAWNANRWRNASRDYTGVSPPP